MNLSHSEAKELVNALNNASEKFPSDVKVIVAPPAIYLSEIAGLSNDRLAVSAQNIYSEDSGAYTGEVSASMLASSGIAYTLIGHSERRSIFREGDDLLTLKVNAALRNGILPIFCFGETKDERESGRHFEVVKQQLEEGVFHLSDDEFSKVILAYEPVWAIGTGLTATADQAQEMHAFIRKEVASKYGDTCAQHTTILYGGSCKPSNAAELFANPDVDGGLIGGASLKSEDFAQIIAANS